MRPEYPEQVKFIWNRASREQVIVMVPASVRFTEAGAISDPDKPAHRIKVKNGMYTTDKADEIEFLKSHPDFGAQHKDGFSIMKKIEPKDELKSMMERTGLSKEEMSKLVAASAE